MSCRCRVGMVALVGLLAIACRSPGGSSEGGPRDASLVEAGPREAGGGDGPTAGDAATADATSPEAGRPPDATSPDTGPQPDAAATSPGGLRLLRSTVVFQASSEGGQTVTGHIGSTFEASNARHRVKGVLR